MKHSSSSGKYIVRQSARTGLLLVLVAALTLAATSLIQSYYMQKGLQEEASRRADSHLNMTRDQILDVIDQAEMAVRNNVWIARWSLENRVDSLPSVSRRIVEENDVVVGSTLALFPGSCAAIICMLPISISLETACRSVPWLRKSMTTLRRNGSLKRLTERRVTGLNLTSIRVAAKC